MSDDKQPETSGKSAVPIAIGAFAVILLLCIAQMAC